MITTTLSQTAPLLKVRKFRASKIQVGTEISRIFNSSASINYQRKLRRFMDMSNQLGVPERLLYLTNLGAMYLREGFTDISINCFQRALALERRNVELKHNLLLAYITAKDFESADKVACQIEDTVLDESHILAGLMLFYALLKKDVSKAIFYGRLAIRNGFENVQPYQVLSFMYVEPLKDYDSLDNVYHDAVLLGFGSDPILLNNMAYGLIKRDELDKAKGYLHKIEIDSLNGRNRVTVLATWGLYYLNSGQLQKGNTFYKRSMKLALDGFKLVVKQKHALELGYYYLAGNKKAKARNIWKKGLMMKPAKEYFSFADDIQEALKWLDIEVGVSSQDQKDIDKLFLQVAKDVNSIKDSFAAMRRNLTPPRGA